MAASDPTAPEAAAPRVALDHLIDDRKTAAADNLRDLSDALRHAADHLGRQRQTVITDLAQSAADRVEAVAGAVRERDLGMLLDDAKRLAQRQPELFFVGAVALGFLFSRVLRSPSPPPPAVGPHPLEPAGPVGPT